MMNWDQTDTLNEIAKDGDKTADQRQAEIREIILKWAIEENTHYRPTEYELAYMKTHPTYDPSTQSSVRVPLPGQTGYSYYPGA